VDRGAFLRFAQFVYTGDYSIPDTIAKMGDQQEECCILVSEQAVTRAWKVALWPAGYSEGSLKGA
jgi:hypothetical protein